MDIFTIKEKINYWYSLIYKTSNVYEVIKIIQEIRTFYSSLSENHKNIFINNFHLLKKRILDYIYSNDSNVRNEVVKFALLFNFDDIARDVTELLKIEKNQESMLLYLDYMRRFNLIGYVNTLFEFSKKQDLSLIVKVKAFSVLVTFLPLVKSQKNYLKYIFEQLNILLKSYLSSGSASFFFSSLSFFFDSIINELREYYLKNKQIKSMEMFYNFFSFLACATKSFLVQNLLSNNFFSDNSDNIDEEKLIDALLRGYILIFFIKIILNSVKCEKELNFSEDNFEANSFNESDSSGEESDAQYYPREITFYILVDFFFDIFNLIKKKHLVLIFLINFLEYYGIFDDFKKFFLINDNMDKVANFLVYNLDPRNDRLSLSIFNFVNKFSIVLNDDLVKKISDFSKKIDNDNILLLCLDILDRYNYYDDLFLFVKYSTSYGLEVRNKIKEMMSKMIRDKSKSNDDGE